VATAEIIRDSSRAVPLCGDAIQGSIHYVGAHAGSWQSHAPVFYIPEKEAGAGESIWEILVYGAAHTRRRFETKVAPKAGYQTAGPFQWDRLNLELMRIASLEPNWDGEGAKPVPQQAATNATVLLFLAKTATERSTIVQCTVPDIFPDVEGGVILKWVQGNKELKCIVRGDIVEVVRWRSKDGYESDGFWEIPAQCVTEHFEWLLQQ
jgi:hypothetical protein